MNATSSKPTTRQVVGKIKRQKQFISIAFIVLLVAQMFLFYGVTSVGERLNNDSVALKEFKSESMETLVNGTIRPQERIMLDTIREEWIQYLTVHPDTELTLKENGNYVYGNPSGKRITFNPLTMNKIKTDDTWYTISSRETGDILADRVRPLWNIEVVQDILDIIGTPVKAFGPMGDPLIYDAYTGEIIVDNSGNTAETTDTVQADGKRNIRLLYLHPNGYHADAVKDLARQLMWRKDSNENTHLVSLYNEMSDMDYSKANDFNVYPLGQYHREFVEKVILPYESVGVEGLDLQIGVAIGAQEQEIAAAYKKLWSKHDQIEDGLKRSTQISVMYPLVSIGISLAVILLAMFAMRISQYQCQLRDKGAEERGA